MIKTLIALLLTTSSASAEILCSQEPNSKVIAKLESQYQETVHFVGAIGSDEKNLPMELTISPDGTWTMVVITPEGTCLIGAGVGWQAVEPKPEGTEN